MIVEHTGRQRSCISGQDRTTLKATSVSLVKRDCEGEGVIECIVLGN